MSSDGDMTLLLLGPVELALEPGWFPELPLAAVPEVPEPPTSLTGEWYGAVVGVPESPLAVVLRPMDPIVEEDDEEVEDDDVEVVEPDPEPEMAADVVVVEVEAAAPDADVAAAAAAPEAAAEEAVLGWMWVVTPAGLVFRLTFLVLGSLLSFLYFIRRFWNQILIWRSERHRA